MHTPLGRGPLTRRAGVAIRLSRRTAPVYKSARRHSDLSSNPEDTSHSAYPALPGLPIFAILTGLEEESDRQCRFFTGDLPARVAVVRDLIPMA
jgi:hypothetical protein